MLAPAIEPAMTSARPMYSRPVEACSEAAEEAAIARPAATSGRTIPTAKPQPGEEPEPALERLGSGAHGDDEGDALEDEAADQQPHHPPQRRRRKLRRDEVPVAEQHARVDRPERERRKDQLPGEERGVIGPTGGGQHDERRDPDEPGGDGEAAPRPSSQRRDEVGARAGREGEGQWPPHRGRARGLHPGRQCEIAGHEERGERDEQPGHEQPIAAGRAAETLGDADDEQRAG